MKISQQGIWPAAVCPCRTCPLRGIWRQTFLIKSGGAFGSLSLQLQYSDRPQETLFLEKACPLWAAVTQKGDPPPRGGSTPGLWGFICNWLPRL